MLKIIYCNKHALVSTVEILCCNHNKLSEKSQKGNKVVLKSAFYGEPV